MSSILKALRSKRFTVETLEKVKTYAEENNLALRHIKLTPSEYRSLQADWKLKNGTELPDLRVDGNSVVVNGLTISLHTYDPEDFQKFKEEFFAMGDPREYLGPPIEYLKLVKVHDGPGRKNASKRDDWSKDDDEDFKPEPS